MSKNIMDSKEMSNKEFAEKVSKAIDNILFDGLDGEAWLLRLSKCGFNSSNIIDNNEND